MTLDTDSLKVVNISYLGETRTVNYMKASREKTTVTGGRRLQGAGFSGEVEINYEVRTRVTNPTQRASNLLAHLTHPSDQSYSRTFYFEAY